MDPVPLKGETPMLFSAGLVVRIVEAEGGDPGGRFRGSTARYFYQFSTTENREILTFHWTPEASDANAVTFPHLHIGPAIVSGQMAIRPNDLHKAHVPTSPVSIAAVVRFAITEFGVTPLHPARDMVLRRSEEALAR